MEKFLIETFALVLNRYGLLVASISTVLLAASAVVIYYGKVRVGIMREDAARHAAERKQELDARDADRKVLLDELKESREQMIAHIERDRKEKDRLTRTLGSMVAEIRAQVKVLDSIRSKMDDQNTKSEQRVIRIYQKIEDVHRDVIEIKGHRGVP